MELQKLSHLKPELIKAHPTKINRLLRNEEVIAAPCSSINLLLGQNVDMALPLGVACNGAVDSVFLGIRRHDEELVNYTRLRTQELARLYRSVKDTYCHDMRLIGDAFWAATAKPGQALGYAPGISFTKRSASGATIAKIFYRMMFGDLALAEALSESEIIRAKPSLELVIGDDALRRKCEFDHIIDLGTWWKKVTDLPFVYAVWQKGPRGIPVSLKKAIFEAASLAQAKMHIDPSEYLLSETPLDNMGNAISLQGYWNRIRYRLGPSDFRALALFLSLGRNVLHCKLEESFLLKINRWEELIQSRTSL